MNRDKLKSCGIDYEAGLKRFSYKPDLYEKYLRKFFEDEYLSSLCSQINKREYESAFSTAHALKGMSGNLSMNEFYKCVFVIVENLRAGQTDNIESLLEKLVKIYEIMYKAIKEGD